MEWLNITVSPLRKQLLFICYSCSTVFTNYKEAKTNFHKCEQEALKLLTEPVIERKEGKEGQLPFIPYLKRRYMTNMSSSAAKVPKLEEGVKGNGIMGGQGNVKDEDDLEMVSVKNDKEDDLERVSFE